MDGMVNDESYERTRSKYKIIGIILIILGLLLIAGGIYFIYQSTLIKVPEMGADNWFEIKTSQMHGRTYGMFMIIPGLFLLFTGIIVRFIKVNQRSILSYELESMVPAVTKTAEKMAPALKKLAKEMKDDTEKW